MKTLQEKKIELLAILKKHERQIDDSDYHDVAIFDCDYNRIVDKFITALDKEIEQREEVTLLSDISEKDKADTIDSFIRLTAKHTLKLFMMLGLKTHIEAKVVNDVTDEEYIFSFKKVEPKPVVKDSQSTEEPQEAEDMLKTKVIKQNGHYKVQFSIGVQYFTLDYEGDNPSCRWMIRMLESAFKTHAEQYHNSKMREVSDEEVERAFSNLHFVYQPLTVWKEAIKWYRDYLLNNDNPQ